MWVECFVQVDITMTPAGVDSDLITQRSSINKANASLLFNQRDYSLVKKLEFVKRIWSIPCLMCYSDRLSFFILLKKRLKNIL